jgi:RNA polymerase sigma-70 factor, ECF subfamily
VRDRPMRLVRSRPTAADAGDVSDAALVLAARNGQRSAEEALYRRYARMVHAMAFRLMGSDADVDDLAQDAFVEALTKLSSLDEPAAFSSWLGAIVVRTASKRLRRHRLMTRFGLRRATPIDLDQLPLSMSPPDVAMELRLVYAVLEKLPVEERVALVLRRVEGLELKEIAERMDLSLATVKRRLAAAETSLDAHAASLRGGS